MASQRDSALYNMIEFQRPANRSRRPSLCGQFKELGYINSKYYRNNGIYSEVSADDFAQEEIYNFFKAFEKVCDMNDWIDNLPRWQVGANKINPFCNLMDRFWC